MLVMWDKDIQESSREDNAKFSFLGIIWKKKKVLQSAFFWDFRWPTIPNVPSVNYSCRLREILGSIETFRFDVIRAWNICKCTLNIHSGITWPTDVPSSAYFLRFFIILLVILQMTVRNQVLIYIYAIIFDDQSFICWCSLIQCSQISKKLKIIVGKG